jgi:hypothetical protein
MSPVPGAESKGQSRGWDLRIVVVARAESLLSNTRGTTEPKRTGNIQILHGFLVAEGALIMDIQVDRGSFLPDLPLLCPELIVHSLYILRPLSMTAQESQQETQIFSESG